MSRFIIFISLFFDMFDVHFFDMFKVSSFKSTENRTDFYRFYPILPFFFSLLVKCFIHWLGVELICIIKEGKKLLRRKEEFFILHFLCKVCFITSVKIDVSKTQRFEFYSLRHENCCCFYLFLTFFFMVIVSVLKKYLIFSSIYHHQFELFISNTRLCFLHCEKKELFLRPQCTRPSVDSYFFSSFFILLHYPIFFSSTYVK
jgi:hypothetical protein